MPPVTDDSKTYVFTPISLSESTVPTPHSALSNKPPRPNTKSGSVPNVTSFPTYSSLKIFSLAYSSSTALSTAPKFAPTPTILSPNPKCNNNSAAGRVFAIILSGA